MNEHEQEVQKLLAEASDEEREFFITAVMGVLALHLIDARTALALEGYNVSHLEEILETAGIVSEFQTAKLKEKQGV